VILAACGQDPIAVSKASQSDYNRGALLQAIDRFVASGRSAVAFGTLANEVAALRPGMDEAVAEDAERRMLVLALDPAEVMAEQPLAEQVSALATTVWPFGLARPLTDPPPTEPAAKQRASELRVKPGETPDAYLVRLCGTALALECKLAVPELQGAIVRAAAVARLTARTRDAVQSCAVCGSEPTWNRAVVRWEALDQAATSSAADDLYKARPERWPMAGPGAGPWPELPLLVIEADGDAVLDGVVLSPIERVRALARARRGDALGVHVPPDARVEQLDAVATDAGRAGYREIVVQVREAGYPWVIRGYRFAVGARATGLRAPWRRADTVQVVLRAVDAMGSDSPARL
jgi:hypothetical protein